MQKGVLLVFTTILALIFFVGCPSSTPEVTTGTVTISVSVDNSFSEGGGTVYCSVTGQNSSTLAFSFNGSGTTVSQTVTLEAGTYTFTFSGSGLVSQTKSVTVSAGGTASCDVTMQTESIEEPEVTTGSLSLTVTVPDGWTGTVTAALSGTASASQTITFNGNTSSAVTFNELAEGSYTVTLTGDNLVTTQKDVSVTGSGENKYEVELPRASVSGGVSIEDNINSGVRLEITGVSDAYIKGHDKTITAGVSYDYSGEGKIEWRLDGEACSEATDSLSLDISTLDVGTHYLSAVLINNNTVIGMEAVSFQII